MGAGSRRPWHVSEVLVSALGAGWVLPYLLLAAATVVGGGRPSVSLFDFPWWCARSLQHSRTAAPWRWVGAGPINQVTFWLALTLEVSLIVAAIVTFRTMTRRGLLRRHPGHRPTARWAVTGDLHHLTRGANDGTYRLALGRWRRRLVRAEPGASTLVFGPTQSGKSSAFCVPAILEWPGPLLVTSTKRDLVDVTAGWRRRLGPVHVYDPTGSTGLTSVRWSPMEGCEAREVALRRAAAMAAALNRGSQQGGGNDWRHWEAATRKLLGTALFVAAATGRDINEVRRWIDTANSGCPIENALEEMTEAGRQAPRDIGDAADTLAAIETRPEVERQTVYSTTQQLLDVFLEESVARSAEATDLDLNALLEQRGTLYLCAPVEDQRRIASLFSGLLMSAVDRVYRRAQMSAAGRLDPPLLLVLDEAANIAPLDDLPQLASQGWSQGLSLLTIFQDLAQLEERYGEMKARTIINNHRAKVVLRGISDVATCEYISKLVGNETVRDVSYQGRSATVSQKTRAMAPPEVIRTMAEGTALAIYGHVPPFLVRQRPWWKDDELRRRATVAAA